jgi:arginine/ornithine transport system substrate-binding protein
VKKFISAGRHRRRGHAGAAAGRRPGHEEGAHRRRGRLSALQFVTADGQLVGLRHRHRQRALRGDEGRVRAGHQDWDGIIPALQARKYDAIIASMSITPERKERVDFTKKYYNTPAKFVRKKGSGIEITKESGLAGKVVGVQRATIHDNFVTDVYGDTVEVKRYAHPGRGLPGHGGRPRRPAAGRLGGPGRRLPADRLPARTSSSSGPATTIRSTSARAPASPSARARTICSRSSTRPSTPSAPNGTYKAIQDKYFDFDVYGS